MFSKISIIFFVLSFMTFISILINFHNFHVLLTYGQESELNLPKVLDQNLKVEIVAKGLKNPTTMDFLNPNNILVLEKDNGTVRSIVNGTIIGEPLLDVDVVNKWERGMLGIAIVGNNKTNDKQVLLYYTESFTGEGTDKCNTSTVCLFEIKSPSNRIYKYDISENMRTLVNKTLLLSLPAFPGGAHNGGIIKIDKNNTIYLVVGEVSLRNSYISNSKENKTIDGRGGILRMDTAGNPVEPAILDTKYPVNLYYAYGIRNSFGLDFDPVTGSLWDTENGPGYGDEINLVEPGFNSGWDRVQGFWIREKYFGGPIFTNESDLIDFNGKGKYSTPELTTWNLTLGLTSLKFMNSEKFGENYTNDLFVGSAHFNGDIYHFDLTDSRTSLDLKKPLDDKIIHNYSELSDVIFGKNFGLVSDIKTGPDGYLYVVSLTNGAIYRISPK